jgi:glycosyltransferase involved in cell wall biosynthesis
MTINVMLIASGNRAGLPSGELHVLNNDKSSLIENGLDPSMLIYSNHIDSMFGIFPVSAHTIINSIWSIRAYKKVTKYINENSIQLVHFHGIYPFLSTSVLAAAYDSGVAVVLTLHNGRFTCLEGGFFRDGGYCDICVGRSGWNGVMRGCNRGVVPSAFFHAANSVARTGGRLFKWVDRFIAVSDFIKDQHVRDGFPARKIVVKNNSIDVSRLSTFQHIADERIGIAYISRISESKGSTLLQQIIPKISQPIHIVGDGPGLPSLKEFCRVNRHKHVVFWGKQPQEKCFSIMSSALCTVIPSQCGESFSLVAAESMALGTPVVGSDIGGLGSLLKKAGGGIAVQYNNPEFFIDAINKLKDNPVLAESMGRVGQKYVEEELNAKRNAEQLMAIYNDALKEKIRNASLI